MQSTSFSLLAPTSWGRLARLARKELRETLRDRRTIGTLILMPLLVYPLLNIAFQKFLLSSAGGKGPAVYRIAVESEEKAVILRDFLFAGEQILFQQEPSGEQPSPTPGAPPLGENGIAQTATFAKSSRLEQDLKDLNVDLAVRLETQPSRNGAQEYSPIQCQLLYRANSPSSEAALRFVEERLRALNERWLEDLLRRRGVERTRLADFAKQSIEGEDAPALSLATLAPLILILMTVTGAVYPAIDLTAGERERGTLETLIAAPVPRMALLAAKYVAVMTVALLTAVVNFVAMTITIASGGLSDYLFGEQGLQAATVFKVFGLTLLLAAFFSAVLLAITSFARSFKEAQAYLIPLTLASLAPGFLALMPGLELNAALALAPLVNIVLVTRDMFRGGVEPLWLMTATASTLLYAVAALAVAAKVFGADALVFGAEEGWSNWLRRPLRMRPSPTLSSALACLAVLLPAYVLAASWLGQFREAALSTRLLGMSVVTALLFGLIPFIAAVLGRVSLRGGFALRGASLLAFFGAAALGVSLWPFAHEIFLINQWLGLVSLDENSLAPALRLVEQLSTVSPWLVLAAFAVAPAVFEEWFFRGYLFGGIRSSTSAGWTIVITAILFGAFHVFSSVLAIERMLPSTFLGLFLGWVRWRTSSVLPGMLLHGCHNGLLIMAAYYRDELTARGWGLAEQSHLPPTWLAAAAVGVAVGVGLLQYTPPPETMVESKELA